jgi:hypothetical protein
VIETFPSGTLSRIGPSGIHRQGSRVFGSGSSFTPSSIAGLELWLAADAIVGKVDADPIATWTDASGAGHDATQATGANQPLYKTGIVNGKPVLRFDAVNDSMGLTLAADASRTIFIVGKQAANTSFVTMLDFGGGNSAKVYNGGASNWTYGTNQAVADVNLGAVTTVFTVITLRVNSAASLDAHINNGAANTFDPDDSITTATSVFVGSRNGGSEWWNGDIAEIISYSNALSNTDRDSVRTYLGAKYGLF